MKIIKIFEQYVTAIFKLGATARRAKIAERLAVANDQRLGHLEQQAHHLEQQVQQLEQLENAHDRSTNRVQKLSNQLQTDLFKLSGRHRELARAYSDLTHRLDMLFYQDRPPQPAQTASLKGVPPPGFEALTDAFRKRLDAKLSRLSEDQKHDLRVFLPEVEAAHLRSARKPALALGFAHPDWVEFLNDTGIPTRHVETDPLNALKTEENSSYAAITAFHLIERLPLDSVLWLTREAMRVLAPGGVLIFKTLNTDTLSVGASFNAHPDHCTPLSVPMLEALFETCGYDEITLRHQNPHPRLDAALRSSAIDDEIAYLLFGTQDITIIGRKPTEQG